MNRQKDKTQKVWDPLVRIGHWTLVATFFIAYFTEDDFMTAHVWAGYVLGAVVTFRIIWGFVGTKYARFRDFVRPPAEIVSYLSNLRKGSVQHVVGHNPAGGLMIILLLVSLIFTVYTGLELYAVEENAGPLAHVGESGPAELVTSALISTSHASSRDDDDHSDGDSGASDERDEEFWEELHEFFANLTLLLIVLHVAGVVVSSKLHKENLVKAMITGRKTR